MDICKFEYGHWLSVLVRMNQGDSASGSGFL